jgi:hypothetical protein
LKSVYIFGALSSIHHILTPSSNNRICTITTMKTRRGSNYTVKPEHLGRLAREYSTLPGQTTYNTQKKRKTNTRSANKLVEERATRISAATPLPDSPTTVEKRRSRHDEVYCTDFGDDRRQLYPGYFFCSPCDMWEVDCVHTTNRSLIRRDSQRYACQGHHSSYIFPTTKWKPWCYARKKQISGKVKKKNAIPAVVADDNVVVVVEVQHPVVIVPVESVPVESEEDILVRRIKADGPLLRRVIRPYMRNANKEMGLLERSISHLREQLASSRREETVPAKKGGVESVLAVIREHYGAACVLSDSKLEKEAQLILQRIFEEDKFGKFCEKESLVIAKRHIRRHVYSPEKVLCQLDMFPMSNIQAVGLFRDLESEKKYSRDTCLPSKSAVVRAARVVEQYGMLICPYIIGNLPEEAGGCEFFSFPLKEVLTIAVKAHGLEQIACERSTHWGQSVDGLCFSRNLGAVNYVLKVQDRAALDIWSKRPLYGEPKSGLQSNQNVICVVCVLGKETKVLTQVAFRDVFHTMNAEAAGVEFSPLLGRPYKPLKVATNGDMKVIQNGLGKGGAFKVRKNPCHICDIKDDDLDTPNKMLCGRWCRKWHQNSLEEETSILPGTWSGKCYHKEWCSEEAQEQLLEDIAVQDNCIESYLGGVEDMGVIREQSTINVEEDPRGEGDGNAINDINSIFYNYRGASPEDRRTFLSNVVDDLDLRNAEHRFTWAERVQLLRDHLVEEYRMVQLQHRLDHCLLGKEDALFVLENAVPCSLHLHMRVILKLVNISFLRGWENACKGVIFGHIRSKTKRVEALAINLKEIFDTQILGTVDNPVNWEFPLDKTKNELYDYSTDNGCCRKILSNYGRIVIVCIETAEDQHRWKQAAANLKIGLDLLGKKDDFSDDDIILFQWHMDLFYFDWIELNQREGLTNYIHCLGSGHIAEYLFRWRNLYVHSNQGFEAWNKTFKRVFLYRTQRGGSAGRNNEGEKSRLIPMAKWMLRRLVWMTGVSFQDMKRKLEETNTEIEEYAGEAIPLGLEGAEWI